MRWGVLVTSAAVALAAVASFATAGSNEACNSGNGSCPDKSAVVPGASCSDEHLQCAYDLTTPPATCDGMPTVIATSCTCTDDHWSCPPAFPCEAGTDGDGEAGTDGEAGDGDDAADGADAADAGGSDG